MTCIQGLVGFQFFDTFGNTRKNLLNLQDLLRFKMWEAYKRLQANQRDLKREGEVSWLIFNCTLKSIFSFGFFSWKGPNLRECHGYTYCPIK